MKELVRSDNQILEGVLCFAGTRVPVAALIEHLRGGHTADYCLEQFSSVAREQRMGVLELVERHPLASSDEKHRTGRSRRAAG